MVGVIRRAYLVTWELHPEGGLEDMVKRRYEKPELTRLGLLRELTKYSNWNDGHHHHWGW